MNSPQRIETVRRIQYTMAVGYSAMGSWLEFYPCGASSEAIVQR
jgi:hypothetical protein